MTRATNDGDSGAGTLATANHATTDSTAPHAIILRVCRLVRLVCSYRAFPQLLSPVVLLLAEILYHLIL